MGGSAGRERQKDGLGGTAAHTACSSSRTITLSPGCGVKKMRQSSALARCQKCERSCRFGSGNRSAPKPSHSSQQAMVLVILKVGKED
jgi:hypothetical protein